MNGEHFPGRLRELRESAGLTQHALAEKVGVQRLSVARWEAGNREPSWSNVLALAAALGVTCQAFDEPPADRQPARPGRPPKLKTEPVQTKRSRGRPKKSDS
jgi:transcriptional regulator with XRE-family HTH domain